ncbi:MAG: PKD domain-containing protein [Candidatus Saccharibacteria bacterium]|nr:PKD domain-containing protein [Candidatus Saccharibacteria bacterium]
MVFNNVLANTVPTAAFTANGGVLTADVNASTSTDPDIGDSLTYDWDFGDGTTGSGVTATHSYASADTYTVTLTVTDSQGATDTESHDVVVTAPQINHAPTAAFTVTGGVLVANVDGSTSSDPDAGDFIFSYNWDFGDGTAAGTGSSASHDYDYARPYTVTLTVTDSHGATSSVSHAVTVTAPALRVTVSDTSVYEPDTGSTFAYLDVTLSRKSTKDVSIVYSTVWLPQPLACIAFQTCSALANPGEDYKSKAGILVIPAGQKTGQIKIEILGDRKKEKDETATVAHVDFEGLNIVGAGTADILIKNED